MSKIKIAIADDQLLFRKAIAEVIRGSVDFHLVAEASNGVELLQSLKEMHAPPDIAIIDLQMPEMNGMELKEQMETQYPSVKVIILSVFNQERFISKLLSTGAHGYLHKNCEIEELLTAIRTVYKSGFYFNEASMKALRNVSQYANKKLRNINDIEFDITSREQEVLLLLCKEYATAEIASQLYISARTVEGHRINLLAKTGCRNTAGLVVFAIKSGLYEPWFS